MSTRRPSLGYALRCLFPSSSRLALSRLNVLSQFFFWGGVDLWGGGGWL